MDKKMGLVLFERERRKNEFSIIVFFAIFLWRMGAIVVERLAS